MKSNRLIFMVGISLLGALGCSKMQPGMPIHQSADTQDERDYCMTKSEDPRQDSLSQSNPTHKILRIYIDTPEQLQAIERDTSVMIFHYCSPSDSESYSPVHYSPSEKGYTYVCDANEAPAIDLYPIDVYWPIGKRVPADYRYIQKDEVFIPSGEHSGTDSDNNERAQIPLTISGRIRAYDNRLEQYLPVIHAKIQYYSVQSGILTLRYTETDSLGYFTLYRPSTISDIDLLLENSNFVIRDGNTSSVKSLYIGSLGLHPGFLQKDFSENFFLDVYQSASYYYYKTNSLLSQVTKYSSSPAINIYTVNSASGANIAGSFSYGYETSPYITIYNPYYDDYEAAASYVFGTVLHEFGHATHYITDGLSPFSITHPAIKESFASFFGWYNVLNFYSDVIDTEAVTNIICSQDRQTWSPTTYYINYTPLYIDLFDETNQSLYYSGTVNDTISGVPVSVILNSALGHTSFQSVFSYLSSFIGQYYTATEYSSLTTPYSIF